MNNRIEDLILENTRITHKNFRGLAGQFNREGDMSFSAIIDPGLVDTLREKGWVIRELPPRPDVEGSTSLYFIPTRVNFDSQYPPEVFLVTKTGLVQLDKSTVGTLDTADIVNIDCTLHAHRWESGGKSGVKAYLRNMYVTIREDFLANKYEEMYAARAAETAEMTSDLPQY